MPGHLSIFLGAVVLGVLASGCSQRPEAAQPVATPTVQLDKNHAAIGSPLDITYRFVVAADAPPFESDYVVFVHFMDAQGERMWTDDHAPPTPTRRWNAGDTVEYQRTTFIPKFPYTGPTTIELGLYSPATGERLPLAGAEAGMRAYRVGAFDMAPQAEGVFVVFRDGWHATEVSEDGALEWQWSRREGVLAFRNPMRDAELILQLDQAVQGLPEPQQVEVRLGATVVDRFSLPPGARELRRIALPASTLGSAETVEVTIAVDRTFVPADVPALRSADARELGIRVFRAYVEPK